MLRVRLTFAFWVCLVLCACSRKAGETCSDEQRCGDGFACLGDKCAACDTSDACKLRGQCVAVNGRCAVKAADDATCNGKHGSEGYNPCSQEGLCKVAAGVCGASADGCKQGRMCKSAGACSVEGGRCVAKTKADCKGASVCLEIGQCTANKGVCAITSDEDCSQSKGCLVSGKCSFDKGGCIVLKDADCKKSALCRAHGQCTAAKGKCIGEKK
jgi:hypothetical protein